jgi:hypothetical protein
VQALGPEATADYTGDAENVISETDSLATTRLKLFQHLKGSRPVTPATWRTYTILSIGEVMCEALVCGFAL